MMSVCELNALVIDDFTDSESLLVILVLIMPWFGMITLHPPHHLRIAARSHGAPTFSPLYSRKRNSRTLDRANKSNAR
jgi:hypothetical protein